MTPQAAVFSVALSITTAALQVTPTTLESPTAAMERFVATSIVAHTYRASRRLEATGSGQRGWLEANTGFTGGRGFEYTVTAEGGSGYIRSHVLRSLLEHERMLIATGDSAAVALSSANYTFVAEGVGDDGLARIAMTPRRKERALIAGHLFVRPEDGELIRVEGHLVKNPSLWITGVEVVRSYQRIQGALVPVLLESTAQLRFLGRSELRMSYRYLEIDSAPVLDSAER